jgi:hypothetical protein
MRRSGAAVGGVIRRSTVPAHDLPTTVWLEHAVLLKTTADAPQGQYLRLAVDETAWLRHHCLREDPNERRPRRLPACGSVFQSQCLYCACW